MNCPHCAKDVPDALPKARFDEVNAELKAARAAEKDARAELLIAQRSTGDVEAVRKELESVKAGHARELAFLGAGLKSAEDRDLVEWRYGKLPEEGRPAFDAWLAEGAKADPVLTKAGIFGGTAAPAQTTQGTPPAKPPATPPPTTNTGAIPTPPPNTTSTDAIQRMGQDGTWLQNRDRVYREVMGIPAPPLAGK